MYACILIKFYLQKHMGQNCPAAHSVLVFDPLDRTQAWCPGSTYRNQVIRSGSVCEALCFQFFFLISILRGNSLKDKFWPLQLMSSGKQK